MIKILPVTVHSLAVSQPSPFVVALGSGGFWASVIHRNAWHHDYWRIWQLWWQTQILSLKKYHPVAHDFTGRPSTSWFVEVLVCLELSVRLERIWRTLLFSICWAQSECLPDWLRFGALVLGVIKLLNRVLGKAFFFVGVGQRDGGHALMPVSTVDQFVEFIQSVFEIFEAAHTLSVLLPLFDGNF